MKKYSKKKISGKFLCKKNAEKKFLGEFHKKNLKKVFNQNSINKNLRKKNSREFSLKKINENRSNYFRFQVFHTSSLQMFFNDFQSKKSKKQHFYTNKNSTKAFK